MYFLELKKVLLQDDSGPGNVSGRFQANEPINVKIYIDEEEIPLIFLGTGEGTKNALADSNGKIIQGKDQVEDYDLAVGDLSNEDMIGLINRFIQEVNGYGG